MDIIFATDKLRTLLNNDKALKKRYGQDGAKFVRRRLDELYAVDNLEVMRTLPGRCHELKGDRQGQLAIDLHKGYRLVFEPAQEPVPTKPDGGLNWKRVTAVRIVSIEDYHDG